jgi:Bacterial Ig-like domain (group 3)/FG-GAP-like repeat/FG-GAP repeat
MRAPSLFFRFWAASAISLVLTASASVASPTFKNPALIPTASDPVGVASADVNRDGIADLVYVDGSSSYTIHVLLGRGNGSFSHAQDIPLPPGIKGALTIADVTGDGYLDLVLAGGQELNPEVAVLVGNGDGTFQPPILSTFQPQFYAYADVYAPAVGDVNGDGKMDIVLADYSNQAIYVLEGDGAGSFTLLNSFASDTDGPAYVADLNGDGKLDLVATDPIGASFLVYLGNGDGTFQQFTRYLIGSPTGSLILADIDGDGHPDMVAAYSPGEIGMLKGNADGTFQPLTPIVPVPSNDELLKIVDVNSDGIPDFVFQTPTGTGVEVSSSLLTYSTMKLALSGAVPNTPDVPASGDFNGDGFTDLAVPVEGGIAILLGNGDGTFASADLYDMGEQAGAAAVADFNGNNVPDIAVTLPATFPRLLLGDGQGGFTLGPDPNSSYGSQAPATNIYTADFNGDGKPDINFGDRELDVPSAGTQSIAFGLGNGTFTTPSAVPGAVPLMADVNGDGRTDMISVSGFTATVLLGQANETFNTVTTTIRVAASVCGIGDVNGDGKPDLLLNYGDHIEVWFGNGDGTFTYGVWDSETGLGYDPIAGVLDLDGDGKADILFGPSGAYGSSQSLVVLYGNGDGTFQAPVFYPISHLYTQILTADVDRDGKPDLIMTDGHTVAVMTNAGGRAFGPETYYVAGQSVSWLSVGDLNGDGFPDIVATDTDATTVAILLNEPNGPALEGAQTNGTITVAPGSPAYGQPFAISLSVSGTASGAPVPTGSVQFSVDGAFVATTPLSNGVATCQYANPLTATQHTIVATYNGDENYELRSFAQFIVVQPPVYVTQTSLTVSPTIALASQTVHLKASVASNPPVPDGTVTFFDGTQDLGSVDIYSTGAASLDTALLSIGPHNLTAQYQGFTEASSTGTAPSYTTAIFAPSTSAPIGVLIDADVTTTSLSPSSSSPTVGSVVTFTATTVSPDGVPFGGATFYDGTSVLGTSALKADGSATFSTASLNQGAHTLTAAFNSNGPYAGSVSAPIVISVTAAPADVSPTAVSLEPEMDSHGITATLVATVNVAQGSPSGMVTFLDNGVILGAAGTDQNSRASLTVGELESGVHNFTASFAGDLTFAPSSSPPFEDQWPQTGPAFSLVLEGSSVLVGDGRSGSLGLSIVPISGFQAPIQLSCAAGLPERYDCVFSPASLNVGGTSILKLRSRGAMTQPRSGKIRAVGATLGLLSFGLFAGLIRRQRGLSLLLTFASLIVLGGCTIGLHSETQSQIVVLTVRATSGTGPNAIVHSAQIPIIAKP